MSAIDELTEVVQRVATTSGQAVVSIGLNGRGSGFVVAPNRVVTNAHNLRDRTTQVTFADGRAAQATVAGSDVDGDVVVLDVDTDAVTPLTWSPDHVAPGDVIVAVSAGRHQRRTTWGQVTAADRGFRGPRGRKIAGAIEHTAPAPSGSSGGPVLDRAGRVLGLNTHRIDHGFYLARAADDELQARIAAMSEGERFERVEIGVAIAPARVAARMRRAVGLPERDGLLIHGVVDGSPAANAGIEKGDLLIRAGDQDLATTDDMFAVLATKNSGDELTVDIVRGTDEQSVTVIFGNEA